MNYKNNIGVFIGDKKPEEITNQFMNEFVLKLAQTGLGNKTIKDSCIVVKMILDFYYEQKELPPVRFKIRFPQDNNTEKKIDVYSDFEQKKIVNFLLENHNPKNLAIALTLCTGIRIGELCALKWSDIDLEEKVINIEKTIQRIYTPDEENNKNKFGKKMSTQIIFQTPKTNGSRRSVPIANFLIKTLKLYKRIMKDEYYFNTGTKDFCEPRTFRSYYNKTMREIGIDKPIKFHGLRHSFATRMISQGTDLKTTSMILGHSKVEMTMNLYVHPTEQSKNDAINKSMAKLFK